MNCKHCGAGSRVLSAKNRERLRECLSCKRRWRSIELLLGYSVTDLPATAESVWALRQQGRGIREIGEALCMSTRTVQEHLAAAPTLETVWA